MSATLTAPTTPVTDDTAEFDPIGQAAGTDDGMPTPATPAEESDDSGLPDGESPEEAAELDKELSELLGGGPDGDDDDAIDDDDETDDGEDDGDDDDGDDAAPVS